MTGTASARQFLPLLNELYDAFAASPSGEPVIPPGRREAVVDLLTRVMTDRLLFTAYTELLESERSRRGLLTRLLSRTGPDIPEKAIIETGFVHLSDAVLADLALSPEALGALDELLYGEDALGLEMGDWFLHDEPPAEALPASSVPGEATVPVPTARPKASRLSWVAATLAVAASLLVGIFLGSKIGGGNARPEFALAGVEVRRDPARGPDDFMLEVRNSGSARAFVTVVGIVPGNKFPRVFDGGKDFLPVPPRGKIEVKNLPPEFAGVTLVLVVLTDVPAGEVVRRTLPEEASAENAAALAEKIRGDLSALGFRSEIQHRTTAAKNP